MKPNDSIFRCPCSIDIAHTARASRGVLIDVATLKGGCT